MRKFGYNTTNTISKNRDGEIIHMHIVKHVRIPQQFPNNQDTRGTGNN